MFVYTMVKKMEQPIGTEGVGAEADVNSNIVGGMSLSWLVIFFLKLIFLSELKY
jgi:hypothetical protein